MWLRPSKPVTYPTSHGQNGRNPSCPKVVDPNVIIPQAISQVMIPQVMLPKVIIPAVTGMFCHR